MTSALSAISTVSLPQVLEQLGLQQVAPTVAVGTGSAEDLVADLQQRGYAPLIDRLNGVARVTRGKGGSRHRGPDARQGGPAAQPETAGGRRSVGVALVDVLGPDVGPPDPRAVAQQVRRGPEEVADRVDEALDLLLDPKFGVGFAQAPAEQLRMLARAQEEGSAVMIEYCRGLTATTTSLYLLDEVQLEPGAIRAWDPDWESAARFRLSDVRRVEPT